MLDLRWVKYCWHLIERLGLSSNFLRLRSCTSGAISVLKGLETQMKGGREDGETIKPVILVSSVCFERKYGLTTGLSYKRESLYLKELSGCHDRPSPQLPADVEDADSERIALSICPCLSTLCLSQFSLVRFCFIGMTGKGCPVWDIQRIHKSVHSVWFKSASDTRGRWNRERKGTVSQCVYRATVEQTTP